MAKRILTGSFVALITPFADDGSVDIEGFGKLIEFQALNGTSAVLIMGSTGEVSLLSQEERHRVIAETVAFKRFGLPLFYGCTANNTRATIAMVKFAATQGADGAIITAPSYIYAPVDAAVAYFLEVADASPIPVGIYNNPIRVGTDLPAEAIIRLAEHPNIVIDKEAMARPGQIAQILASGRELSLMCCDSPNLGLVPAVMSLGGHGTANMTGNIAPREMAIISKPWKTHQDAVDFRETYLKNFAADPVHLLEGEPRPGQVAGAGFGPAGRGAAQTLSQHDRPRPARGVEVVQRLGLAEQYGYRVREDLIGEDAPGEPVSTSVPAPAATGSGACFIR